MTLNNSSSAKQYERNLRNIEGTFAVEDMSISENNRSNLERIAYGKASCQQILQELLEKYRK